MAAKRPVVNVYSAETEGVAASVPLPEVLAAPIRADIVHRVHKNIAKNKRQAHAVANNAGEQTSAMSWGTGRAVARIPRVGGGGTSRSGQGCFGNMCRGGRMFNPSKTWRKWHRQSNQNERRVAICSALAASAVPALVMARGHRINDVAEIPCVLSTSVESTTKTKDALAILQKHKAMADIERCQESKKVRTGKGKMRNRRYQMRRGPLVVYAENNGVQRAFRNISGVELACVDRLNLLQLAPGGHLGRYIIWTQAAFEKLDTIFGTRATPSSVKKYFTLPHPQMVNADLTRIINSDEVQSKLNAKKTGTKAVTRKLNPLKNLGAMLRVNPYASTARREEIKRQRKMKAATALPSKTPDTGSKGATKRLHYRQMTHALKGTEDQQGADFLVSYNNNN